MVRGRSGDALSGREAVSHRALGSWLLPTPLPLYAGVVALWLLATVARRPTASRRLLAEALGTTLEVIGTVQRAWIALLSIGRRELHSPRETFYGRTLEEGLA